MNWEEARRRFLVENAAGLEVMIVRRVLGPAPPAASDFLIVERRLALGRDLETLLTLPLAELEAKYG